MKLVRLKPFNGKQHVLRTYNVFGIKFEEKKGWYEVDDDVAEYLAGVKQFQDGADADLSANAFDVVDSREEAEEIDEREKARAARNTAVNAERKVRVHTPFAGRTMPMQVRTNLQRTRTMTPSPVRQSVQSADAPKWAHADKIVPPDSPDAGGYDPDFDTFDTDDMPNRSLKAVEQRIDGKVKKKARINAPIEEHAPDEAIPAKPKAKSLRSALVEGAAHDEVEHALEHQAAHEEHGEADLIEGEDAGNFDDEGAEGGEPKAKKKKR